MWTQQTQLRRARSLLLLRTDLIFNDNWVCESTTPFGYLVVLEILLSCETCYYMYHLSWAFLKCFFFSPRINTYILCVELHCSIG